jgi:hypothetical protein
MILKVINRKTQPWSIAICCASLACAQVVLVACGAAEIALANIPECKVRVWSTSRCYCCAAHSAKIASRIWAEYRVICHAGFWLVDACCFYSGRWYGAKAIKFEFSHPAGLDRGAKVA